MSWRNNASRTGANDMPLGNRRRFGADRDDSAPPPPPIQSSNSFDTQKRGRSPEPPKAPRLNPDGTKKRRKANRWGDPDDNQAAGLMNLPTTIEGAMTAEQQDAYVTHLRIEEITQNLRIGNIVPRESDRFVSPETIQDSRISP